MTEAGPRSRQVCLGRQICLKNGSHNINIECCVIICQYIIENAQQLRIVALVGFTNYT